MSPDDDEGGGAQSPSPQLGLFEPEPGEATEILLQLGAEGGSWTLSRRKDHAGQASYSLNLNQSLFDDMEPRGAPHSRQWESIDLRRALLELSKGCPFTTLIPVRVHPEIVTVLRALRELERALGDKEMMPERWDEALAGGEYRWGAAPDER
ncbi:MAG: hypothetical protein KJ015_09880 [Myxococcales bacterium]|nr:hypothetical protein [Myxococcales bacterium]